VLVFRVGQDEEVALLPAGLGSSLLPVPESVGLLGLAVDFDRGGVDLVDATDVGLLFSDADLLVAKTILLVPCPVLLGVLVGLLDFSMVFLDIDKVNLLDPGIVDAEPRLDNDDNHAEELNADGTSSEMGFSTLSSFMGTSITAWMHWIRYCFGLSPEVLQFAEMGVGSCCVAMDLNALDDDVDMDSSGSSDVYGGKQWHVDAVGSLRLVLGVVLGKQSIVMDRVIDVCVCTVCYCVNVRFKAQEIRMDHTESCSPISSSTHIVSL
jgi:hypothetical protein